MTSAMSLEIIRVKCWFVSLLSVQFHPLSSVVYSASDPVCICTQCSKHYKVVSFLMGLVISFYVEMIYHYVWVKV